MGPELNSMQGLLGVWFLYRLGKSPKSFISYSLSSVGQIIGEITLKNIIHILYHRSCYLCCLHIQNKLSFYTSEPPLKGVANPLKIKNEIKSFLVGTECKGWSYLPDAADLHGTVGRVAGRGGYTGVGAAAQEGVHTLGFVGETGHMQRTLSLCIHLVDDVIYRGCGCQQLWTHKSTPISKINHVMPIPLIWS